MQRLVRHMNHRSLILPATLALVVSAMLLLVAGGGDDEGLSRAEVEEIVRAELAESPPPPTVEPGLTSADVEEAIEAALADMPQPEPGLTKSEALRGGWSVRQLDRQIGSRFYERTALSKNRASML